MINNNTFFFSTINYTYILLEIEDEYMTFINLAGYKWNELHANVAWEVTSKPFWLGVSPFAGTWETLLKVEVGKNTGEDRTGIITIEGGGRTINIQVLQAGST